MDAAEDGENPFSDVEQFLGTIVAIQDGMKNGTVSNLAYRRLAVCGPRQIHAAGAVRAASRLEIGDTAGWKPALPLTAATLSVALSLSCSSFIFLFTFLLQSFKCKIELSYGCRKVDEF